MKKTILTTTFLFAGALGLFAQGTLVLFSNDPGLYSDGADHKVYMTQLGVDPVNSDQWKAQLEANLGGIWSPIGAMVNFYGDFGGAYPDFAGWWPDDGTLRPIPGVTRGTPVDLRVGIYDGQDRLQGYSPSFAFTHNPAVPAPTDATYMLNFPAFVVPEPSTIALGVLGLGALLLFRRRK